jgi:hypothetical protein
MPEVNGTHYADAPPEVIAILERCRADGTRIRVAYGHADGQDWGDTYCTTGYVGRSCGPIKIPLLIHNTRSMGGGGILTDKVIRIETTKGRRVLYQHPAYKPPKEVCDAPNA